MNLAFTRAIIPSNFLALVLALAAATRYVVFTAPSKTPWWELLLSVGLFAFVVALPFTCFLSRVLEGGGDRSRYFVTMLNFLFCVFGGFALYYALQSQQLDSLEMFVIGFSPVALANAVYLILIEE